MYDMLTTWISLKSDTRAVTALEYGLIAAVIAGVVVAGYSALGNSISSTLSNLNSSF